MQNILFDLDTLYEDKKWFVEQKCDYFIIDTEEKVKRLAEILRDADIIAYDIETTGLYLGTDIIVGVSVSCKIGQAFYIPLKHYGKNLSYDLFISYLKEILETKSIVGHNLKFDYKFTKKHLGVSLNTKHDTYVIAKLLDEYDAVGLKYLGSVLLDLNVLEMTDVLKKYKVNYSTFNQLTAEECYTYGCQDVDLTLRLLKYFIQEESWKPSYIYDVEMDIIKNLSEVEIRGVQIDYNYLKKLDVEYSEKIKKCSFKIYKVLGKEFNLNSTKEFGDAFLNKFPEMRKSVKFSEKTKSIKLNEECCSKYLQSFGKYLEKNNLDIKDNVFSILLERKKLFSVKTKYTTSWIKMIDSNKSDIIYTSFTSMGAGTGRMSSQNPNMQNIAPKIRHAIIPRKGYYFISMDFDQVEWRIFSAIAGIDHLIEGMNNGSDIHTMAASLLFNLPEDEIAKDSIYRKKAKTLNFGLLYGMGVSKLANSLDITEEEAKDLKKRYMSRFLKGTKWFNNVVEYAKIHGYVLTSFGRKRRIDNINLSFDPWSDQDEQKEAKKLKGIAIRKAHNTPIQGTSADITKIALNKVCTYIRSNGLDIHPINIIHDDILYEVNEKYKEQDIIPKLKECMEMVFKDKVKLTVDNNVSRVSWGALKDGE